MGPKEAVTYVDGTALCIDCATQAGDLVVAQTEGAAEAAPTASPVRVAGRRAG
jgi:hypothetical protein